MEQSSELCITSSMRLGAVPVKVKVNSLFILHMQAGPAHACMPYLTHNNVTVHVCFLKKIRQNS